MSNSTRKIKLTLSESHGKNWLNELSLNIKSINSDSIHLNCKGLKLTCKDIKYIKSLFLKEKINLLSIESTNAESIVSASALGIQTFLKLKEEADNYAEESATISEREQIKSKIFFHQGTLRSGEILEVDHDVLILGDVNPGAIVIAGGNVKIWGRLLGIAHAGKDGDSHAKITALQLRPVQLRISDKIARGPSEKPDEGFAEEAKIEKGIIVIKPARTN